MLENAKTFHGLAVDDLQKAREFYGDTLGLTVTVVDEQNGLLSLERPDGGTTLLYLSPDLQVGNYTVLNFSVADIDATVDALAARGVRFERYDIPGQDEKGVMRGRSVGRGPDIAWFKDPAGHTLSVLQEA
jgi:catechol 2,3-dioxygenase-like lactoylglutathione lyase family enzyme